MKRCGVYVRGMGWLRLVGSVKLQVSFAECSLFVRALLQNRRIILKSLPIVAAPYMRTKHMQTHYTHMHTPCTHYTHAHTNMWCNLIHQLHTRASTTHTLHTRIYHAFVWCVCARYMRVCSVCGVCLCVYLMHYACVCVVDAMKNKILTGIMKLLF